MEQGRLLGLIKSQAKVRVFRLKFRRARNFSDKSLPKVLSVCHVGYCQEADKKHESSQSVH